VAAVPEDPGKKTPRAHPSGRTRIAAAFASLLRDREFGAITTADIARTAGVNEALLYKYFGDKRGLLHQVLCDILDTYLDNLEMDLKGIEGALNKLRRLIWLHLNRFANDRVFARSLLLEVRNFRGYFDSESYRRTQRYGQILAEIIAEGVRSGEIRDDIPVWSIRQSLLGAVEHLSLPAVIFGRDFSPDEFTADLCRILFGGIAARR
jgi:TetR/AcrR family transcriptional regulator, fatty acid metabolism regulator protein